MPSAKPPHGCRMTTIHFDTADMDPAMTLGLVLWLLGCAVVAACCLFVQRRVDDREARDRGRHIAALDPHSQFHRLYDE